MIGQDEIVLTRGVRGLQCQRPWRCPEILLLQVSCYQELCTKTMQKKLKGLSGMGRMDARLIGEEKVVRVEVRRQRTGHLFKYR